LIQPRTVRMIVGVVVPPIIAFRHFRSVALTAASSFYLSNPGRAVARDKSRHLWAADTNPSLAHTRTIAVASGSAGSDDARHWWGADAYHHRMHAPPPTQTSTMRKVQPYQAMQAFDQVVMVELGVDDRRAAQWNRFVCVLSC
jgi:hypothetical protein